MAHYLYEDRKEGRNPTKKKITKKNPTTIFLKSTTMAGSVTCKESHKGLLKQGPRSIQQQ